MGISVFLIRSFQSHRTSHDRLRNLYQKECHCQVPCSSAKSPDARFEILPCAGAITWLKAGLAFQNHAALVHRRVDRLLAWTFVEHYIVDFHIRRRKFRQYSVILRVDF